VSVSVDVVMIYVQMLYS